MVDETSLVFVVNDDEELRRMIADLKCGRGLSVKVYASAKDFRREPPANVPACLVLDVHLPDGTGLDIQRTLGEQGHNVPIIFISGQADVPTAVRAMKAGAIEFLLRPFRYEELLEAMDQALAVSRAHRETLALEAQLRGCYELLSPEERAVLDFVATGTSREQIGDSAAPAECGSRSRFACK